MTEFGYYPGCALHGTSNDYEKSLRTCLDALGVTLKEVDDWVCCGASAAHCLNHTLSVALPARNLGIAERDGHDEVLAPCPMCSMELIKARRALESDQGLREKISEIVELPVTGKTEVLNAVQVFQRIGLDTLRAAVKRPLKRTRVACYYGCLLTRPPSELQFDDFEQPRSMEEVVEALGAEPVEWNYATECCGAGMTLAREETVLELAHKILSDAEAHRADCLVVACPMCQVNLDMKQSAVNQRYGVRHELPVYYLSDLVGLALGIDGKKLAIDRHFVVRASALMPPVEAE
jgi:heterodisulfide reductase subunit B